MSSARTRFINGFKNFDLFSQPIQLFSNNKEHHQTIFGSLLTIGLVLLFANLFYIKIVSLFSHSSPISFSSEVYHPQPDYFKLTPDNFTITFAFQNSTFNTYIDDSVYVVKATMEHKHLEIINGTKQSIWESRELPLSRCNPQLIKQAELKEYFSHLDLNSNYCIDWNQLDEIPMEGTFDANYFQHIKITFHQCTNETKKGQPCKSKEEIAKALDQNYFSVQLTSYTTDLTNPINPYIPKGQDIFTTISSKIFKEISVYLEPLTALTDLGYLQTDVEQQKTLRYGRLTEMLDLSESDLIMNFIIRLDTTEYVDYRQYPKLQEILGELGGLWQVLFSVFYMISKPLNRISYFLTLINQLNEEEDDNLFKQQKPKNSTLQNIEQPSPLIKQITQNTKSPQTQVQQIRNQRDQQQSFVNVCAQYLEKKIFFRRKKLDFGFFDYLCAVELVAVSDNSKIKQFQNIKKDIISQINIVEILRKLQDVEKLKNIIFSEEQKILFENILKPTVRESAVPENASFSCDPAPKKFITQSKLIEVICDQNNQINQRLVASLDATVGGLLSKTIKEKIKE